MKTYELLDFSRETQQSTDVLHKNVNLEGHCWLVLFLLIVPIVLVITIYPAKKSLQISASIVEFVLIDIYQLIVEPFHQLRCH